MKTLFFSFNFKRKRTYMDRDRERLTGIGHWQSSASSRMTASAIGNDLFVTAARNVQKRLASFICFAFDCNAFAFVSQNNLVGYSSFFFLWRWPQISFFIGLMPRQHCCMTNDRASIDITLFHHVAAPATLQLEVEALAGNVYPNDRLWMGATIQEFLFLSPTARK